MPNKKSKPLTVGLVSLGCSKNEVDLQVMAGALLVEGIELARNPDEADVILVNTCAFIEAARREANDEILRACALKRAGKARFVVVTGCLPQRYGDSLLDKYPDVDGWIGIDHLFDLPSLLTSLQSKVPTKPTMLRSKDRNTLFEPPVPEFTIGGGVNANLKIADGCNHACAYCAIPAIRGKLRSRLPKGILVEARALLRTGIRELDVVAQDITAYGRDLKDGTSLSSLLKSLDRMRGDFWIRLLYGYPPFVTDDLLDTIASARHICRYLDIPLQHSHPDILRAMRRADTARLVDGLPARLRSAVPGIALRTTFIVGFPGETEEHFAHLLEYIKENRFDQLGAFAFSPEEGTPAASMDNQVPAELAQERLERLLLLQQKIVSERLASLKGSKVKILTTGSNGRTVTARTAFQAPGVDGEVLIAKPPASLQPGMFAEAVITGYSGYDLKATIAGGK